MSNWFTSGFELRLLDDGRFAETVPGHDRLKICIVGESNIHGPLSWLAELLVLRGADSSLHGEVIRKKLGLCSSSERAAHYR